MLKSGLIENSSKNNKYKYFILFIFIILFNIMVQIKLGELEMVSINVKAISFYFLVRVSILSYNNKKISFKELFSIKFKALFNYLVIVILFDVFIKFMNLVPIPLIVNIIKIIVLLMLSIRLIFINYLIIDKNINFVEGLKESFSITNGKCLKIFKKLIKFILIALVIVILASFLKNFMLGENTLEKLILKYSKQLPLKFMILEEIKLILIEIVFNFYFFKMYKEILSELNFYDKDIFDD